MKKPFSVVKEPLREKCSKYSFLRTFFSHFEAMSSDYFHVDISHTGSWENFLNIFYCKNFMAVHGSLVIGAGLNLGKVTIKITFLLKFLLYHLNFW